MRPVAGGQLSWSLMWLGQVVAAHASEQWGVFAGVPWPYAGPTDLTGEKVQLGSR